MTRLIPLEHCALVDLTDLPRMGLRGADSAAWLNARGYLLPGAPNHALAQPDGGWVARLSQSEYLLLGSLADRGARITAEEAGWQLDGTAHYLLPRQDSHAWLTLTGRHAAQVMAKVCGVDLRPEAFPSGAVAQTSAARINVIAINAGDDRLPRLHLLCDRPSLAYFHSALLDAMAEFGGQPVTLDALPA